MKQRAIAVLLALLVSAGLLSVPSQAGAQEKPKPAPMKLKVGDQAPDFTLKYYDGQQMKDISLHEFRGKKNVLVAFFVFAFTGG